MAEVGGSRGRKGLRDQRHPIAAVDVFEACRIIGERAPTARGGYITVTGAHGIVEAVYDDRIIVARQCAAMSVADGMPLVWLGRALGYRRIGRVNGAELMELIFAEEKYRRLRHFCTAAIHPAIDRFKKCSGRSI